jgi:hypothetical protein
MPIVFSCQSCHCRIKGSRRHAGLTVACPSCHSQTQVFPLVGRDELIIQPPPLPPPPVSATETIASFGTMRAAPGLDVNLFLWAACALGLLFELVQAWWLGRSQPAGALVVVAFLGGWLLALRWVIRSLEQPGQSKRLLLCSVSLLGGLLALGFGRTCGNAAPFTVLAGIGQSAVAVVLMTVLKYAVVLIVGTILVRDLAPEGERPAASVSDRCNAANSRLLTLPDPREETRVPPPQTAPSLSEEHADITAETPHELRPIWINGNLKVSRLNLPRFLLKGRGHLMEPILTHFVEALQSGKGPGVAVGWVSESENVPDRSRPVRVTQSLGHGHTACTDVVLQRQGGDLFIGFGLLARTRLVWLKRLLYGAAFVILFAISYGTFWRATGVHESWVREFARKHAARDQEHYDDNVQTYQNSILYGYNYMDWDYFKGLLMKRHKLPERPAQQVSVQFQMMMPFMQAFGAMAQALGGAPVDPLNDKNVLPADRRMFLLLKHHESDYNASWRYVPPWTYWQLFKADPMLALSNLAMVPPIIAGLIGLLLYLIPHSLVNYPCRWLGWPTPERFTNTALALNSWAERVLSDVLLHEYGVQEGDKFAILTQ